MRKWETPSFVEIKMDAEIGSYQEDDFGDERRYDLASVTGSERYCTKSSPLDEVQ